MSRAESREPGKAVEGRKLDRGGQAVKPASAHEAPSIQKFEATGEKFPTCFFEDTTAEFHRGVAAKFIGRLRPEEFSIGRTLFAMPPHMMHLTASMILWMWLIPVVAAAVIILLVLYGVVKNHAGERIDGQTLVDRSVDER